MTEAKGNGRPAEAVIQVKKLSRAFGRKQALADVSFEVAPGCVFGLLGESGAGKTTIIRHLLGLMKPQSGSVRVVGCDPVANPEAALGAIGYLSEDRDMPRWMRLHELMRYSQGFYPSWDENYANQLIDRFDLDISQKVRTLSRGQMAKMGLILALAHRPQLLILDEPSSGLDVVVRRHILDAIMRTVADEGRTVLFSSHLMDEVEEVADYVAIVHRGQLMLCDRLERIKKWHRKIHIEFSTAVTAVPKLEGVLHAQGAGAQWTTIFCGEFEKFREGQVSGGYRIVKESPANLEEIFVARITD